jgi:hypothetical protein
LSGVGKCPPPIEVIRNLVSGKFSIW